MHSRQLRRLNVERLIMNQMTKDIMVWLKVDVETALKVQNEMMCSGVSFSNSSTAVLKRLAKECLNAVNDAKDLS
jgi:hypothetical protein